MNNKLDKISIIVPVYNVENYIERCIKSLLNQTYRNIEIIIIDDGSTDNSEKLCDQFKNEERVLVIHTKNAGVSKARNLGIEKASGNLIGFVDADDYVREDMFENLYKAISEESNIDIVMCNYFDNKKINKIKNKDLIVNKENLIKQVIGNGQYRGFIWNKLFKKDIIKKNKIKFKTDIDMCEDLIFCLEYMQYVIKGFLIKEPYYYYENRKDSISNLSFNNKRFSILKAYDYILSFKYIRNNKEIFNILKMRQIKHCISLWYLLNKEKNFLKKKEYVYKIKQRIKEADYKFLLDKTYQIKYKVLFIFLKLS